MDETRRRLLMLAGTTALAAPLTGCGTLLYPERRGQTGGRLDTGVVILDGLGLLLFLVPGLIAFAVDFGSGAIYLPGGSRAEADELTEYKFAGKLTEDEFDRAWQAQYGAPREWSFDEAERVEVSDVAAMRKKLAALNGGMMRG